MAAAYGDIARLLGGARRREARVVLSAALAGALAAVAVAILLGAIWLWRGWGPEGAVRNVALASAALALLAAAVWAALALLRRASSPGAVARAVGTAEPALRSDLLSAVELHEARDGLEAAGYSVALADEHVTRTAGRMEGIDLRRAVPALPARRAGLALGAALAANLLALGLGGGTLAASYAALAGLGPRPPAPPPEPITGDVELTYRYPAHTGRPPRTVSGTGGEIAAPRGTEVAIAARADRPVESAEIAVESATPPAPAAEDPVRPSTTGPASGAGVRGAPGPYAQDERAAGARVTPPTAGPASGAGGAGAPGPSARQVLALEVKDARQLSGRLVVDEPGTYRFRFKAGRRVVAEGPPLPIAVEPDAFPEVRITAPGPDVEVDARARLRVDWSASDDYGLRDLALMVKPPAGAEERRALRTFERARRESGSTEMDLGALGLAEGERLLYWLEVRDNDEISGPKRGASATQQVRIYSESEHRRRLLERAQALWEQMVRLLGDRLEFLDGAPTWTEARLAQGAALDTRTRALHESLQEAARALRRERGAPRAIPDALATAAAGIRGAEQPLGAMRLAAARLFRTLPQQESFWARLAGQDQALDRELEKDVLYLEALFDAERAQDLLRLAKDLQAKRRDLAGLLEKYRQAPSEAARRHLVAEIQRMKQRMREMARRMAELAKGIQDEHLNREALAELAKQDSALSGLDRIEQLLARGDIEGAMRELDALGSAMQRMLAGLERAAGSPDERSAGLRKEIRAFQKRLEEVERDQERLAGETGKVREEYRRRVAEQMKRIAERAGELEKLAREASAELQQAREGITLRVEEEFAQSRERLADLEKGLRARDYEAALDSVRRALPSMQRMAMGLEEDALLAERLSPQRGKPPAAVREAGRHAVLALKPARKVRDELEKLFPDPRSVLSQGDQQKLDGMARRQSELERQAGQLRQALQDLAERAPVFPPRSQAMLGEAQGHMAQASGELAQRNPQKGHGQQRQALDALGRFRRGLEEMAKGARGGPGGGLPIPFALAAGEGGEDGDMGDPSREKVEIPGADAYKVPEEFRRDILEAMKQGAPEPYRPELQRYYEELVR